VANGIGPPLAISGYRAAAIFVTERDRGPKRRRAETVDLYGSNSAGGARLRAHTKKSACSVPDRFGDADLRLLTRDELTHVGHVWT